MDNEIKGYGNATTAQYWEYDTRIGRRWNLDPKPVVGISDYAVFKNSHLLYSDPLGDSSKPGFLDGIKVGFTGYFKNTLNAITHPKETLSHMVSIESFKNNALDVATMGG